MDLGRYPEALNSLGGAVLVACNSFNSSSCMMSYSQQKPRSLKYGPLALLLLRPPWGTP